MNPKRKNYIVRSVLKEEIRKYLKERQGNGAGQRLPMNIKREALHDILGIPHNKLVDDYSVDELVTRQKSAIDSGKIDYATMIRRINWVQVLNKTRNPSVTKKFRSVIRKLHDIYKK